MCIRITEKILKALVILSGVLQVLPLNAIALLKLENFLLQFTNGQIYVFFDLRP